MTTTTTPPPTDDRVVGLAEAARRLGLSYTVAKQLARKGELPGQLPALSRNVRVSVQGIEDYLGSYHRAG